MTSPARSEDQLTPAQRKALGRAHQRLREAVAAYEPFRVGQLQPGKPVPVHNLEAMAKAQAAIEEAEAELWHLREDLLGWRRPVWAPRAELVSDWFSPEDAAYDDVDTTRRAQ